MAARVSNERKAEGEKKTEVRTSNILAAKSVADAIRTSLGPRGMDKMIVDSANEIIISNDGATIMNHFSVTHPCAKMLVELSKAQDIEAGDGTSTVVVLAGALLRAVETLLARGIHPTRIADSFQQCAAEAEKRLLEMAQPIKADDRDRLVTAATTSLASKVVASHADFLAPIAVDAVRMVTSGEHSSKQQDNSATVDLNKVRIVKALGGTIDDTELIHGVVFKQPSSKKTTGTKLIKDAKIALIQFCLSPPKTDMENQVVVNDYAQMDRVLKEERDYLLDMCKVIKKSGCNVLLIQKSILRDAITDQSLHFLSQMKILVVMDVERDDVPFICETVGCSPISHIDHFTASKFGTAAQVHQTSTADGRLIKITGVQSKGTASVLMRGTSQLVVDEAERSLHDALCVVRSLVKRPFILPGGAAVEIEIQLAIERFSRNTEGYLSLCAKAYAEAFETIPYTLAENAGLRAMTVVTDLRAQHRAGHLNHGVNVKRGLVSDMVEEKVLQPLVVSSSAVQLATELTLTLLKVDDIVTSR